MARLYGLRFGMIAAALTLCSMTTTTASSLSAADPGTMTTASTLSPFDNNVIMIISVADYEPAFALPAVIEREKIARDFPAYRPRHPRPHAIGGAVRPTSVAGWRSGRVRQLASG